jgi:probable HAF family extracellular repeat protein
MSHKESAVLTQQHSLSIALSAACFIATSASAALPPYVVKDLGTHAGPTSKMEPGSVGMSVANGHVVGYAVTALESRNFHAFKTSLSGMVDLGVLAGDEQSIALGVNVNGDAVGVSYKLGELTSHGVFWSASGVVTPLGTLEPRDVNSQGAIAGSTPVNGALGTSHATRRIGNVSTDLGTLGGISSMAFAINESNWVVGQSLLTNNSTTRAFVVPNGAMLNLGTLGGTHSRAMDISGLLVVGIADIAGNIPRAALWTLTPSGTLGSTTNLGTLPGAINSAALAVNATGTVVGNSGDAAFVWSANVMFDLNTRIAADSGWHLQRASGIDDAGRIVGTGKHFGLQRAFLLTPRDPADLDADGVVGAADLAILLGAWGGSDPSFDLTGNGSVGAEDLGILLGAWSA